MTTVASAQPTFAQQLTQLDVVKALAIRYPEAADALSAIVVSEEQATNLDSLTTEQIARRAAEGHDVTWGWQDSFESGDEDSVWLDLGELRLEISESADTERYCIGYYNYSRWYAEATAHSRRELFDIVVSWVQMVASVDFG